MKKIGFGLMLVLVLVVGCTHKDKDIKFHECEFDIMYWETPLNIWIESKEEASNLKITFTDKELNQRDLDSLYQTTAQYIFSVQSKAKDCSARIKNDTLYISYKDITYPPNVEPKPLITCLEFNKTKYLNYKDLKIVYIKK